MSCADRLTGMVLNQPEVAIVLVTANFSFILLASLPLALIEGQLFAIRSSCPPTREERKLMIELAFVLCALAMVGLQYSAV